MKLQQAVEAYLSHKRSLGMQCKTIARHLRAFCKGIGDVGANEVRDDAVRAYIYGSGPVTTNLHVKFGVLRGFYRYLLTRGYVASSPLPTHVPRKPEQLIPHIFTREEIRQLLRAAQERQWHARKLSHPLRHIQYNRTANLRAIATLAMRRSRRTARCRNRRRQSGS